MEFIFACLSAIQIVFIVVNIFTTLFFRLERAVVHQVITTSVITGAYAIEVVLKLISHQSFGWQIVLALLWGFNLYSSVRRLKRVNRIKKKIEEEEKRNQF